MTRFHFPGFKKLALPLLGVLLVASAAGATTITWNNASGGAWSNAANWTPNNVPDAAGETAVLPALSGAYTVTLDVNPACDGLDIAAGNPTLDANGQSLAGITLVTNHGAIANFTGTLDTDRIRNQSGGVITVADAATITLNRILWNAGKIVLPAGTTAQALDTLEVEGAGELAVDGQLLTNMDPNWLDRRGVMYLREGVLLHGGGTVLTRLTFNEGTVAADAENGTLTHPFSIINQATGTIRVSNNATLRIASGYIENSGLLTNGEGGGFVKVGFRDESMGTIFVKPSGRVVATPGDLRIHCGSFVNATLERSGESGAVRIVVATLENVSVAEEAELVIETLATYQLRSLPLVNNGIVRVLGVMQFGNAQWSVEHALTGSGKIVLEGGQLGMPDGDNALVINQQLIEGCGTIYGPFNNEGTLDIDCTSEEMQVIPPMRNTGRIHSLRGPIQFNGKGTVTNLGTISADGGRVEFKGGVTLDNRAGTLLSNRGMVDVGGVGGGTIWGGRLASNGTGQFGVGKTATLKDVTIASSATVVAYGGTTLNAAGTRLVNEGTLKVWPLGNVVIPSTTEYVQTSGLTSIEKGTFTSARDLRIEGGVLRGGGTINGNVVNSGMLMPDPTQGPLKIVGSYRQTTNATFHAMLGGTSSTANSRLDVTGTAFLDGSLATSTIGSFHPSPSTTFQVMSFGAVAGRFLPGATPEGGLDLNPVYSTSSLGIQFLRPQVGVGDSRPALLAFYGQRSRQGASFVLELPQSALLKGRVYDAAGREVARLADGVREAGVHSFAIGGAGTSLNAGIYFARMVVTTNGVSEVKTARVSLLQ